MDKIVCLGKNYSDHIKEMRAYEPASAKSAEPFETEKQVEPPVLFLKPPSSLIRLLNSTPKHNPPQKIEVPFSFGELHPELEIVIQIGNTGATRGRFSTPAQAYASMHSIGLGLDLTLRDLQSLLKKKGQPWEISKSFKNAAVLGPMTPLIHAEADIAKWLEKPFYLKVNNNLRQQSTGQQMLLKPAEALIYASQYFEFCPGDLLFTGTPAGVAAILAEEPFEFGFANVETVGTGTFVGL